MFEIKKYTQGLANEWNLFVEKSKNGTFLFNRNYMDYHSSRFNDYSLLVYRKDKLYTILPANRVGDVLYSHQGLTYGGFIMSSKVTTLEMVEVFGCINEYLLQEGVRKIVYKPMPFIYHQIPAQEDLYALFKSNAKIIGRNISSTIFQNNKIKFIESRKSGIRKALNNDLIVKESTDYESFWEILDNNLKNKYGAAPVHSLEEIKLLNGSFPKNIKLYLAYKDDMPVAGTVLYLTPQVLHTQYISASPIGKELGALDLIFDQLINKKYTHIPIFDFGQSTEQMGSVLNESLIFQKEGFGGRGVVYDIYEYSIINENSNAHIQELFLEKFDEVYLNDSWRWLNDPEIKTLTDTPDLTIEKQKEWFQSLPSKDNYFIWGINYAGERIGVCGLKNIFNQSAEYWMYIGNKSMWGQGLGKEIFSQCIQKAKELGLCSLSIKVLISNTRSIKLHTNLGFRIYKQDNKYAYMNIGL